MTNQQRKEASTLIKSLVVAILSMFLISAAFAEFLIYRDAQAGSGPDPVCRSEFGQRIDCVRQGQGRG